MADIAALLAQGSRFDPIGAASRGLQVANQFQGLQQGKINQLLQQEQAQRAQQGFEQQQRIEGLREEDLTQQLSAREQKQINLMDDRTRAETQRKINSVVPALSQTQTEDQALGVMRAGGFEPDAQIWGSNLPLEQKKALTIGKSEAYSRSLTGRVPAAIKSFAPVTLINPQTQEKMMAFPTFDPKTGQGALKPGSVPAGFQLTTETPEEKRKGKVSVAKGKEEVKLESQKRLLPEIRSNIKRAETEAKGRGETLDSLGKAKAALPGIIEVGEELKKLAPIATHTAGGRIFNTLVKEAGFGATKGGTARSQLISIIDNQILPLLRPIFGAAFTKAEGDSLKATLGDPDSTPEAKIASVDAFIAQTKRNIETKERELGIRKEEGTSQRIIELRKKHGL